LNDRKTLDYVHNPNAIESHSGGC